ncbi:MAG: NAD-dependent epimerase/dehydratase family protein [Candidatus Hydrogenedentes bacterium]|nr:NAD-dependent epimerase/dehydratase family protein [Candidatus Hydrogenedentota bacterium]
MNTILVTGGAGFVGSHLAMGMKARYQDTRVIAFDNLRRRGAELNLARLNEAGVEFLHGDIRNPGDLSNVGSFDLLLECSAEPSVLAGYDSAPTYVLDTNLTGTLHCLEAARQHRSAILFLSTSRVYPMETIASLNYEEGETRLELAAEQPVPGASAVGISEAFPLEGTRSLYGATKLASELIMNEYLAMYNMRGVINRCGILTGPWQMGKVDQGVVVLWAARHIYGGQLKYIGYGGEGKQVRDMLHVDDLLDLILHQIENLDALSGRTFNVGGGRAVSASLQEYTGYSIPIAQEPENRAADIPLYITDNRRVTEATGWKPTRTVPVIMDDICRWITDNRDSLAPILNG